MARKTLLDWLAPRWGMSRLATQAATEEVFWRVLPAAAACPPLSWVAPCRGAARGRAAGCASVCAATTQEAEPPSPARQSPLPIASAWRGDRFHDSQCRDRDGRGAGAWSRRKALPPTLHQPPPWPAAWKGCPWTVGAAPVERFMSFLLVYFPSFHQRPLHSAPLNTDNCPAPPFRSCPLVVSRL